ncbi:MAG: helix-turn-helix transcriptional regulator [Lewinellaceae bacterium]|nr:helix-turn-helix transcriptional regulator [Lewinellaceae bacterium]
MRSIRLQHAKKLLATSDLTVSEIAYEVGFTSPSYFSTAFLEEFGVAPSATCS